MSNLNHFHLEKTGKEQSVEELTKQIEHLEYNLEECRKKRMHYQQLFHSAPAGYLVFDQEGRIADANQRFCSMVSVPFQDRCSYNIERLDRQRHQRGTGYDDTRSLKEGSGLINRSQDVVQE